MPDLLFSWKKIVIFSFQKLFICERFIRLPFQFSADLLWQNKLLLLLVCFGRKKQVSKIQSQRTPRESSILS
jgi:hypothetical protein